MSAVCALLAAALSVLLSGPALAAAPDRATATAAIVEAGQLQAEAERMNDAWSPTAAALTAARAALAKEDYATAAAEAGQAGKLARLSIAQARAQETLWQNAVPH